MTFRCSDGMLFAHWNLAQLKNVPYSNISEAQAIVPNAVGRAKKNQRRLGFRRLGYFPVLLFEPML